MLKSTASQKNSPAAVLSGNSHKSSFLCKAQLNIFFYFHPDVTQAANASILDPGLSFPSPSQLLFYCSPGFGSSGFSLGLSK